MNKICTKCKQEKSTTDFYKGKTTVDKLLPWCKTCHYALRRRDPVDFRAKRRAAYALLKKRDFAAFRLLNKTTKLCKYKLTPKQYDDMLSAQGNLCAICKTDTPGGHGTFHVDHDHKTGKIRGLLCNICNLHLGIYEKFVDKATIYLNNTLMEKQTPKPVVTMPTCDSCKQVFLHCTCTRNKLRK